MSLGYQETKSGSKNSWNSWESFEQNVPHVVFHVVSLMKHGTQKTTTKHWQLPTISVPKHHLVWKQHDSLLHWEQRDVELLTWWSWGFLLKATSLNEFEAISDSLTFKGPHVAIHVNTLILQVTQTIWSRPIIECYSKSRSTKKWNEAEKISTNQGGKPCRILQCNLFQQDLCLQETAVLKQDHPAYRQSHHNLRLSVLRWMELYT